jgi:alpha-ketoglutarate-dependent taurine dioxygenase
MSRITINRLTDLVGAEITGLDVEQFQNDDALPGDVARALEQHGVLVFPKLGLDPAAQVAFGRRLGVVEVTVPVVAEDVDGVSRVSLDPTRTSARTLRGAFNWHMDGCTLPDGRYPGATTILTAVALADEGGQTEFASTYVAYDALTDAEKAKLADVRVVHTVAATQRLLYDDPTPEQEAEWSSSPTRVHPLVWQHGSGRRSMVLGATAESVVGLSTPEGRALLDDVLANATSSDRVYRHEWSVGDLVVWDNTGMLHRVEPYADDSPREMIRTTLRGDEPIQ